MKVFKKFYFLAIFSPVFLFSQNTDIVKNRFYITPGCLFFDGDTTPTLGIGYRYHKEKIGGDISLHSFLISICGQIGGLPYAKGSFLYYPQTQGVYCGVGVNAGVWGVGPVFTGGCEFFSKSKFFLFAQADFTYPRFAGHYSTFALKNSLGSVSLGIGF